MIFFFKLGLQLFLVARIVANEVPTFAITDTKCDVPIGTLLIQDNAKLLEKQKNKSGFKIAIFGINIIIE